MKKREIRMVPVLANGVATLPHKAVAFLRILPGMSGPFADLMPYAGQVLDRNRENVLYECKNVATYSETRGLLESWVEANAG